MNPVTVTAIVIGAGCRGTVYSDYALDLPEKLKVVAVADPREHYRSRMQKKHQIHADKVFTTWEEIIKLEKLADCAIITTQDQQHRDPAVALAGKGYHILLEKPMAVTYDDCRDIITACKNSNVMLTVCHVLRYTPQARKISELLQSGIIGDIVNIQHLEPIGYWHYAHSYVRGNWRNMETSTFTLLAKSCHDLDLIQMWMRNKRCISISSFGSLKHFTSQNKPAGASARCLDCKVESSCPYSAKKIYLGCLSKGHTGWPVSIITEIPDIESVTEALRSGPYGRCVYESDNDVVDNQVVAMQFEGGATASFSMIAFTEDICVRKTHIFGTRGELTCNFNDQFVMQYDFLTRKHTKHSTVEKQLEGSKSRLRGHGGADFFAMDSFIRAVSTGDASHILTGPEESLRSHALCFAAEKSRLEKRVIDLSDDQMMT